MNGSAIPSLFRTLPGRRFMKLMSSRRADSLTVRFLRSHWSIPLVYGYTWRHHISLSRDQLRSYRTFRDFFARDHGDVRIDDTPEHLISPCDGWLTSYPIESDSGVYIKGIRYRVQDLIDDPLLAERFEKGFCLVFRLSPSDCHHYCFIDDGYLWQNHHLPGGFPDTQASGCETYPAPMLHRRCWCLMATRNFGPVVQAEIGAFAVGSIANRIQSGRVCRGEEKGHFELAGSTIALLFEPGRIHLLPNIQSASKKEIEARVRKGMWIGNRELSSTQP